MTVVPHPRVPVEFGPEVRLAVVVDLGREAQQAAVGVGWDLVGGRGQTVLLIRTLQHEHGPVLHVGGLLHHLRVQHQIGGRWRREDVENKREEEGDKTDLETWSPGLVSGQYLL